MKGVSKDGKVEEVKQEQYKKTEEVEQRPTGI